jgi:hypothetical protein
VKTEGLGNDKTAAEVTGGFARFKLDHESSAHAGREGELILAHGKCLSAAAYERSECVRRLRRPPVNRMALLHARMSTFPIGNIVTENREVKGGCSRAGTIV